MSCDCNKDSLSLKESYELMVAQIDRELTLVDNRLRWFLTFNGFIFAAFILTFRVESADNILVINTARALFPLSGIILAIFILLALFASQNARDKLKKYWKERDDGSFPPAYSDEPNSGLGRNASNMVPITIGIMWLILLFTVAKSS